MNKTRRTQIKDVQKNIIKAMTDLTAANVATIRDQVETIKSEEEEAFEDMSESKQNEDTGEIAQESIRLLEDAGDYLEGATDLLTDMDEDDVHQNQQEATIQLEAAFDALVEVDGCDFGLSLPSPIVATVVVTKAANPFAKRIREADKQGKTYPSQQPTILSLGKDGNIGYPTGTLVYRIDYSGKNKLTPEEEDAYQWVIANVSFPCSWEAFKAAMKTMTK